MIDKKEFESIRKEMERTESLREEIISLSREIISVSKRIIYSVHRKSMSEAAKYVREIEQKKGALDKINKPVDANINKVAYQEYAEAVCYYGFVKNGKVPSKSELGIDTDDYLMGLCDLSGELERKAVNSVIDKDFQMLFKIKELVDEIYGEFLKFNLRNGELRKKSDSIKWSLKKIEDVIFEAKIKGMV